VERQAARVWALTVLVVCSSACSSPESRFIAPTPTPPPVAAAPPAPAPQPPPPPLPIPSPSGPSRVYDFAAPLTPTVAAYSTRTERSSSSTTRWASYRGRYEQTETGLAFYWQGSSGSSSWGANASLSGDTLTVRYSLNMQMSDFEDAVYQLQGPG
jgi:hypothetical protein